MIERIEVAKIDTEMLRNLLDLKQLEKREERECWSFA